MLSVKVVLCVVLAAVCAAAVPFTEHVETVGNPAVLYDSNTLNSFEEIEKHNATNGNSFNIGYLHPGSVVAQS